jgi:hypothetical protein
MVCARPADQWRREETCLLSCGYKHMSDDAGRCCMCWLAAYYVVHRFLAASACAGPQRDGWRKAACVTHHSGAKVQPFRPVVSRTYDAHACKCKPQRRRRRPTSYNNSQQPATAIRKETHTSLQDMYKPEVLLYVRPHHPQIQLAVVSLCRQ